MLRKFSQAIADRMLSKGIVNDDEAVVLAYGYEVLCGNVMMTFFLMASGLAIHLFYETITYIVVFCTLRRFTGGYHANTRVGCMLTTVLSWGLAMLFCGTADSMNKLYIGVCIIGWMLVIILAPVENANKPLESEQIKRSRYSAATLYGVFLLFGLEICKKIPSIGLCVVFTEVMVAFSLIHTRGGKMKNGKKDA